MNYWLVKSEPDVWSWSDQCKAKGRTTAWEGVRNAQACNNMKLMRKGDRAFFYHSNKDRQIVGVVEVVKEAYPDPTDETGRFVMVDLRALEALKAPVTLAEIKAAPRLSEMALVRQSRLSVMPIDPSAWKTIMKMAEMK
ncbi:MAG: EVE domain-containing protein [Phycisphaera sp.]|nr:EVE domain-containing protein [Phycisphaera sp.]